MLIMMRDFEDIGGLCRRLLEGLKTPSKNQLYGQLLRRYTEPGSQLIVRASSALSYFRTTPFSSLLPLRAPFRLAPPLLPPRRDLLSVKLIPVIIIDQSFNDFHKPSGKSYQKRQFSSKKPWSCRED